MEEKHSHANAFTEWAKARSLQHATADDVTRFQLEVASLSYNGFVVFINQAVVVHLFLGIDFDQGKRSDLLDLVALLNEYQPIVAVEIDEDSLLLRASIVCGKRQVEDDQLDTVFSWLELNVREYRPILSAFVAGLISHQEARAKIVAVVETPSEEVRS